MFFFCILSIKTFLTLAASTTVRCCHLCTHSQWILISLKHMLQCVPRLGDLGLDSLLQKVKPNNCLDASIAFMKNTFSMDFIRIKFLLYRFVGFVKIVFLFSSVDSVKKKAFSGMFFFFRILSIKKFLTLAATTTARNLFYSVTMDSHFL